jgi:hypothetical protein
MGICFWTKAAAAATLFSVIKSALWESSRHTLFAGDSPAAFGERARRRAVLTGEREPPPPSPAGCRMARRSHQRTNLCKVDSVPSYLCINGYARGACEHARYQAVQKLSRGLHERVFERACGSLVLALSRFRLFVRSFVRSPAHLAQSQCANGTQFQSANRMTREKEKEKGQTPSNRENREKSHV